MLLSVPEHALGLQTALSLRRFQGLAALTSHWVCSGLQMTYLSFHTCARGGVILVPAAQGCWRRRCAERMSALSHGVERHCRSKTCSGSLCNLKRRDGSTLCLAFPGRRLWKQNWEGKFLHFPSDGPPSQILGSSRAATNEPHGAEGQGRGCEGHSVSSPWSLLLLQPLRSLRVGTCGRTARQPHPSQLWGWGWPSSRDQSSRCSERLGWRPRSYPRLTLLVHPSQHWEGEEEGGRSGKVALAHGLKGWRWVTQHCLLADNLISLITDTRYLDGQGCEIRSGVNQLLNLRQLAGSTLVGDRSPAPVFNTHREAGAGHSSRTLHINLGLAFPTPRASVQSRCLDQLQRDGGSPGARGVRLAARAGPLTLGPQQPGPPALRRLKTSKDPNPARPEPGSSENQSRVAPVSGQGGQGPPPTASAPGPMGGLLLRERAPSLLEKAGCKEGGAAGGQSTKHHMWNWVSRDAEPNGCVAVKCLTATHMHGGLLLQGRWGLCLSPEEPEDTRTARCDARASLSTALQLHIPGASAGRSPSSPRMLPPPSLLSSGSHLLRVSHLTAPVVAYKLLEGRSHACSPAAGLRDSALWLPGPLPVFL
ncbi:hypothetical protein Cadr_000001431 [Camelus dromedarius]|uniref:Uncharacterized protein n=1 Tax=Camelus dromedarius TaxID=9838 RepID=A0A5N4EG75_CAMDR|nr:hypothetical protein Cadr_000001431 [Camelus dromedarius]